MMPGAGVMPEAPDPDLEEPLEEPQEPPEQLQDEFVELEGARIPRSQLAAYHAFHQWATSDPARWQQLQDWSDGRAQIAPPGAVAQQPMAGGNGYAPEYPEEDEDTALRMELLATREASERTAAAVAHHAAEIAKERISKQHGLKSEEVEGLMSYALDNQFVALAASRNPTNPYQAVEEALDMAYRIKHFDQAGQRTRAVVEKEKVRKENWRSVAVGSGGGNKRQATPPENEAEALQRMVDVIRHDMGS